MIRSNKFLRGSAAVAGILALTLSACGTTGGNGASANDKCSLAIDYFGALTGGAAALGVNAANGVELAVDQYNAAHSDCQVKLNKIDSQSDAKQAPSLAAKVLSDTKVIGVVGPLFSGESGAADPVFDDSGKSDAVPLISASATNPDLATHGWKVFHRVLGNDATQGPQVTTLLKEVANIDQVFIVEDDSPYGKGLAKTVRGDMGSGVVGEQSVKTGDTDFSALSNSIVSKNPKSVFYSGYYPEAGPFVKQLRAAGYTGVVVTADGVKDPEFIKLAGTAANGTLITCPCVPGENLTAFNDAYVAKFGVPPGTYSPEAFDAANIFLQGIASGITARDKMLEFVNAYDKDGITKHIKFTSTGEPTEIPIWGYKVDNGKIVPIKQLN